MQREDSCSTLLALEQADNKKRILMSALDHKQATAVALHNTLQQRQHTNMQDAQKVQLEIQHVMQHIEQLKLEGDYQSQRVVAQRRQRGMDVVIVSGINDSSSCYFLDLECMYIAQLEAKVHDSANALSILSDLLQTLQHEHIQLTADLTQAAEASDKEAEEVNTLSLVVEKCNGGTSVNRRICLHNFANFLSCC
ncbi:hypothetical protein EON65_20005 [archaeon]|nr:MAG: hypothetical protein EON65_20005 [archaeon]